MEPRENHQIERLYDSHQDQHFHSGSMDFWKSKIQWNQSGRGFREPRGFIIDTSVELPEIRQAPEFATSTITPGASPSTGRLPAFSQCRRISHHF